MTEREKYRTLGTYYMNVAQNNDKAIENYEAVVKLFPADDGGHGNLALAYLKGRTCARWRKCEPLAFIGEFAAAVHAM
jgi:hypothetical protein